MITEAQLQKRIALEKRIVRRIVRDLLAAGYTLSVNNGGDSNEIPYTRKFSVIDAALFATDEEYIQVKNDVAFTGSIFLVYGNDGWDVVNDYPLILEPIMSPINEWTDSLAK